MSHTAISRFFPITSGRRLFLLLVLIITAFAAVSIGHVAGASADAPPGGDDGITIDCSLGDGNFADPGTTVTLPPAGDLPALTVTCDGTDGHWKPVATKAVSRFPITNTTAVVASTLATNK